MVSVYFHLANRKLADTIIRLGDKKVKFMIILETNYGPISIKLDTENTPKTAENFRRYVQEGFYDGTVFHRVIDGFMIQGGGFESDMQQKETHEPIKNEANKAKPNKRGTIAMARTGDPHSATAQFFINVADNNFLDFKSESIDGWGYCVFGEIVDGMNTVDKIKSVSTSSRAGHQDVPEDDVLIKKVTIAEEH